MIDREKRDNSLSRFKFFQLLTITSVCMKCLPSSAFTGKNSLIRTHRNNILFRERHISPYTSTPLAPHSRSNLLMSTAQEGRKSTEKKTFNLPPLPEDPIILGGDILALFTYAFLDHTITAIMIANAKEVYKAPNALDIPVWSDVISNNFGPSLLTAITTQQQMADIGATAIVSEVNEMSTAHYYAPCLESFGVSAVLLGTCWLVSGYFNRAFEYKNTISCSPSHAICVTGRTWLFTAMMMVGLAIWSDWAFCGCHHMDVARGLTKADTDFIFDSFSVLVTWRFVAVCLLGGLL